jgi:16S rRNA (guanine527-N7)-methyltransferase
VASAAPPPAILGVAAALGITLSPAQQDRFRRYLELIDGWGLRVRLTGARDEAAVAALAAESLCVMPFVPESGRLVDLGSGGGMPGIPIAVLRPGLRVVLVEAMQKKAAFLGMVARELPLPNVEVLAVRAEDLGRAISHRGQYDVATARALAPVRSLVEYALPLLRRGGVAILPKGARAADEVRDAARALELLGAEAAVHPPSAASCSPVIVVTKTAPTPDRYPRRAGIPERRPL